MRTVIKQNTLKVFLIYSTAGLLALLILFSRLSLWGINVHDPIGYGGDGLFSLFFIKTMMEEGWTLVNSAVSAPGIIHMHDYPVTSDSFHYLIMKMISFFQPDSIAVMNIYFFLRFPLTALISLRVLRELGFSFLVGLPIALIYTFVPANIFRGQGHLLIGTYYILPAMTLIILWCMSGKIELKLKNRNFLFALLICIIIAGSGVYYSYFACAFLALSGLYSFLNSKKAAFQKLLTPLILAGTIVGVSLAFALPLFIYRHSFGKNLFVAGRVSFESELYGMKIIQLILPISNHYIQLFGNWTAKYNAITPLVTENVLSALGLSGSIGFVFLILWLFVRNEEAPILRKIQDFFNLDKEDTEVINQLSLLNIFSVLLATIGGFGSIIAFFFFPEVRCYNRISIYIAFFSLVGPALLLDRYIHKTKSLRRQIFFLPVLILCTIGAILDQTGILGARNKSTQTDYENDRDFVRTITQLVPSRSMIFQLPYVHFPENPPVNKMDDYEHIKMYLHSPPNTLRWSYPAMAGRKPNTWLEATSNLSTQLMIHALLEKGFNGIYIDRYGYKDSAVSIEREIKNILHVEPTVSRDQRRSFFPLQTHIVLQYDDNGEIPRSLTLFDHEKNISIPTVIDRPSLQKHISSLGNDRPLLISFSPGDGFIDDKFNHTFINYPLAPDAFKSEAICNPQQIIISPKQQTIPINITVKNHSSLWWPQYTNDSNQRYLIRVRSHLLDSKQQLLEMDFDSKMELPYPIKPLGEFHGKATFSAATIPPGTHYLEYDLVQEGVSWAKGRGGKSCLIKVIK